MAIILEQHIQTSPNTTLSAVSQRRRLAWLLFILAVWVAIRIVLLITDLSGDPSVSRLELARQWFDDAVISQGRSTARQLIWLHLNPFVKIAGLCLLIRYGIMKKIYDWLGSRLFPRRWWPEILLSALFFAAWQLVDLHFEYGIFRRLQAMSAGTPSPSFWSYIGSGTMFTDYVIYLCTTLVCIRTIRRHPKRWLLFIPVLVFVLFFFFNLTGLIKTPDLKDDQPLHYGPLYDQLRSLIQKTGIKDNINIWISDSFEFADGLQATVHKDDSSDLVVRFSRRLVEELSQDEVEAVFAHELGHIQNPGIMEGWLRVIGYCAFACLVFFVYTHFKAVKVLNFSKLDSAANLPLIMILFGVSLFLAQPLQKQLSRQEELSADLYALEWSNNPVAYSTALQKLGNERHYDLLRHPLRTFWSSSHPPLVSRIQAVEDWLHQRNENAGSP